MFNDLSTDSNINFVYIFQTEMQNKIKIKEFYILITYLESKILVASDTSVFTETVTPTARKDSK